MSVFHSTSQIDLAIEQYFHQSAFGVQAERPRYARPGHVGVDEQHRAVPFQGHADGKIDRAKRLAFPRQRTGHEDKVRRRSAWLRFLDVCKDLALDSTETLCDRGALAVGRDQAQRTQAVAIDREMPGCPAGGAPGRVRLSRL